MRGERDAAADVRPAPKQTEDFSAKWRPTGAHRSGATQLVRPTRGLRLQPAYVGMTSWNPQMGPMSPARDLHSATPRTRQSQAG
ncbi:hypothetical protein LMG18091_02286 [Ralstonia wenshanensis]|uniref:Uncharacterized protein n=1 Tax=Ralstonia wenshanensis TaxID=2842456 RepID=A0AAD2AZB7_9RALS|nr:hypothetical protein LMG18091_02286 [Ralstonia wenshanensis]